MCVIKRSVEIGDILLTMISFSAVGNIFTIYASRPMRGDHMSGKPGNVREFDSCHGNVRDFTKSQRNVRRKNLVRQKWPKTVYC